MTGPGREGLGWNGRAGGMGGNMYMQHNQALSLSSFSSGLLPTSEPPPKHPFSNQFDRGREKGTGKQGERRGKPKESKHLGNGVLYIHPQGRGEAYLVWFGHIPKGRRKPHKSPLFLSLLSLNSVYCASCSSFDHYMFPLIFLFSLYLCIPLLVRLPSSKQCLFLRIGHRIERDMNTCCCQPTGG